MRKVIIVASALTAMLAAGSASAASKMSDLQYLEAARCRGLAASEGLGKIDTSKIDAAIREQSGKATLAANRSAQRKLAAAKAEGDSAQGAEKEKLLAERASVCVAYIGGPQEVASR